MQRITGRARRGGCAQGIRIVLLLWLLAFPLDIGSQTSHNAPAAMNELAWKLTTRKPAIHLGDGPHLFVDDYLVGSTSGVKKTLHHPERRPEPVIRGPGTMIGPYNTVTYSQADTLYRMWYWYRKSIDPKARGQGAAWALPGMGMAYAESKDGIAWTLPELGLFGTGDKRNNVLLPGLCSTVIDEGPDFPKPDGRYKMVCLAPDYYRAWFSADGIHWREGYPIRSFPMQDANRDKEQSGIGDIISVNWDARSSRCLGIFKQEALPWEGYGPRPTAPLGPRFVVQSCSKDFVQWEPLHRIVTADSSSDQTEFYGMEMIVRGSLYLGFLRVLRDDLLADPGGEPRGIGWTELVTSRDGETWTRIREPFMDRNPEKNRWDHAMTWSGGPPVYAGNEMRFYYGGYSSGHKVGTRYIGLATLPRDRYVSYDATLATGYVRTRPLHLRAAGLTINAKVNQGSVAAQILGPDGRPLPGFSLSDCDKITLDGFESPVRWGRRTTVPAASRTALVVEFALQNAELYGFDLVQTRKAK